MNENKITTLNGGESFSATFCDGHIEEVFIRQLPVKLYTKFLGVLGDELRMVEVLCDKPQGWAEELTPESFDHIAAKGDELNQDFFYRWARRNLARQEKLMPGLAEKILANRPQSPSPTVSQSLPSSPA